MRTSTPTGVQAAHGGRLRRLLLLVGLGLWLQPGLGPAGRGQEIAQFSEYQVKGAFLVKFAMFVEWPRGTFAEAQTPITLAVLGDDPFGPPFEKALQREVANGRPFVLKRCRLVQEAADCQILFIGSGEANHLAEVLGAVRGKPVLTVGDQERFAHRGGMVNFVKEGGRIRFEVNAEAIHAARLKISAKLLQVSRPVTPEPEKGGQ